MFIIKIIMTNQFSQSKNWTFNLIDLLKEKLFFFAMWEWVKKSLKIVSDSDAVIIILLIPSNLQIA